MSIFQEWKWPLKVAILTTITRETIFFFVFFLQLFHYVTLTVAQNMFSANDILHGNVQILYLNSPRTTL